MIKKRLLEGETTLRRDYWKKNLLSGDIAGRRIYSQERLLEVRLSEVESCGDTTASWRDCKKERQLAG
jgi:hypothetical protein